MRKIYLIIFLVVVPFFVSGESFFAKTIPVSSAEPEVVSTVIITPDLFKKADEYISSLFSRYEAYYKGGADDSWHVASDGFIKTLIREGDWMIGTRFCLKWDGSFSVVRGGEEIHSGKWTDWNGDDEK